MLLLSKYLTLKHLVFRHFCFCISGIQIPTICVFKMFFAWNPICRVQQVHEKWVNIRTLLQTKLINVLNIHTNPDFKFLAECTVWVHQKLVSSTLFYIPCSTNIVFFCSFSSPSLCCVQILLTTNHPSRVIQIITTTH